MCASTRYAFVIGMLGFATSYAGVRAESPPGGTSRALIIAGLPGDDEHDRLFADTCGAWRTWLTETLDFAPVEVRILFGKKGKEGLAKGPATREAVEHEVAALKSALRPEDRLWVFFLGHGDYDGEHAYFHLPGRDLRNDRLGKLFHDLRCREQVFWMTTSASGWFLRNLSAKDRIVVTATLADDEYNETEFPQGLTAAMKQPRGKLDANEDGKVSVLEFLKSTVAEIQAIFDADMRVPTEHAQIDDNGDKTGTEVTVGEKKGAPKPGADGHRAANTYLPFRGGVSAKN